MTTQNYTNASPLLRGAASRGVVDTTSRPIDLVRLLQARGRFIPVGMLPRPGAEPYVVSLVTANNSTAGRFTAGQAASAGSRRDFVNATYNAWYWREVVRVSGRNRDIAIANGYVDGNLIQAEQESATMNLLYAIEQDFLGSTAGLGLTAIIDDTALLGGLDPATYTTHVSKVSTVSGALTAGALADHWEAATTAPYNSMPTDVLSAPNQVSNYTAIAGLAGGTNVARRMVDAPGYDIGVRPEIASFNGVPWRQINGLTSTEIYFPNLNDFTVAVQRDFVFEPYGKVNDDMAGQVTFGAMVFTERRKNHSKMEAVNA